MNTLLERLGIERLTDGKYQVFNEAYGGFFVVDSLWIALRIRGGF